MQMSDAGNRVCEQIKTAFSKRGNLDQFWQETADHFFPERADFTVDRTPGADMVSTLYSSEPILFRRDFGNYIGSAIRPNGRQWFKVKARDPRINQISSVQKFLDVRSEIQMSLFQDRKSNFSAANRMADHDYAAFGNSVTSVEPREDRLGLRFRTWHLRDCAWRINYDGEIDTMFRRIKLTRRNLCSRARVGWSISDKHTVKVDKDPDAIVEVYHVLMPIDDYQPEKRKRLPHKFISLYVDVENKWVMQEKPELVFYYAVSRWFTIDSMPYAFSPCVVCSLPDSRSLQTMTWSIIEAGEKAVEPPMAAVSEAIIGSVDVRAGMVTWIDQRYDERTGEAIRAIELGGNPQYGDALRAGITGNMRDAWYLNKLFLPQEGPQMTAEEIMRRHEEFLRVAQPVIEPAETERNGNLLDVAVTMSVALGLWGKPDEFPEPLKGRDVDYTYDNPLQDAQKQAKSVAFRGVSEIVAQAKQLFEPGVTKHLDEVQAFRDAIGGIAPPQWLKDEDQGNEEMQEANDENLASQAAAEGVPLMAGLAQAQAAQQKAAA